MGPPLIFLLFREYHNDIYIYIEGEQWGQDHFNEVYLYEEGNAQRLASHMVNIHFCKMLLESIFVHKLSGRTIPLNRTLWKILIYWFGFGCVVGFTLFNPLYKPFWLIEDIERGEHRFVFSTIVTVLFFVSEFMNLMCHIHFENMTDKMVNAVLKSQS